MDVYDFNERITFQEASSSKASNGEVSVSWSDISTTPTMWAKARPARADEDFDSNIKSANQRYTFMIRHRSDISVNNRIQWDNRYWDIKSVNQFYPEGRNKLVMIEAEYEDGRYN